MNITYKKTLLITSLLFSALLSVNVYADTPFISSFTVPTTLESGQVASISWTISGGGHSFIAYCTQGVKLINQTTNLAFPCDTKVSISSKASDGVSLIVANVSGAPRVLNIKLIPKDGLGVDYPTEAQEASIYVKPATGAILSLYTNSTTTVSGAPTTFFWSSNYLDGVNLKIECKDNITATSTGYNAGKAILPCGSPIFLTDLPGSGSASVLFSNASDFSVPLAVTVLPSMSPGVYDATKSAKLDIVVATDAQQPVSVTLFSPSRQKIYSGDSVQFNWSILNGSGANFVISCNPSLQYQHFQTAVASTTVSLPCNSYAYTSALKPTASSSISFFNLTDSTQTATISIFPQLKNQTYDGTKSTSVTITVESISKFAIPVATSTTHMFSSTTPATQISKLKSIPLPAGTPLLPGCATTYGFSIFSGLPCSDGAVPSRVPEPVFDNASSTPVLPAGCATTYGYSIRTGQPCSIKTKPSSRDLGVSLGGWAGWAKTTDKTVKISFDRALDIGSRGDDVRLLQTILAKDSNIYPEGYINGYFGITTASAVGRFQIIYGLVKSSDDPTYGFVGPSTRAILNSLQ